MAKLHYCIHRLDSTPYFIYTPLLLMWQELGVGSKKNERLVSKIGWRLAHKTCGKLKFETLRLVNKQMQMHLNIEHLNARLNVERLNAHSNASIIC